MIDGVAGLAIFTAKLEGRIIKPKKKKMSHILKGIGVSWRDEDIGNVCNVDIEYIESVLEGNSESLDEAFEWRTTPHGHEYWSIRRNLLIPLSDEDRDFLNDLYEYHVY